MPAKERLRPPPVAMRTSPASDECVLRSGTPENERKLIDGRRYACGLDRHGLRQIHRMDATDKTDNRQAQLGPKPSSVSKIRASYAVDTQRIVESLCS